jgi:RNA polymerase sigma-70 factor, ECF subfamily
MRKKKTNQNLTVRTDPQPTSLAEFSQAAYGELRRIAAKFFKSEQPGRTLQPTALVHETFVRLAERGPKQYVNRAHFFAIAARTMRQLLVEEARRRGAVKRGGGWERVPFDDLHVASPEPPDYVAIDSGLTRLSAIDERLAQILELRVFAGMTSQEIGSLLHIAESTVRRDWKLAETWLRREFATSVRNR